MLIADWNSACRAYAIQPVENYCTSSCTQPVWLFKLCRGYARAGSQHAYSAEIPRGPYQTICAIIPSGEYQNSCPVCLDPFLQRTTSVYGEKDFQIIIEKHR